jgi:hypothetical protein
VGEGGRRRGRRGKTALILNLAGRSLNLLNKNSRYPLNMRLGRPQRGLDFWERP